MVVLFNAARSFDSSFEAGYRGIAMNRNQSIAASAIIAAGLIMRPASFIKQASETPPAGQSATTASEAAKKAEDGPWLASCKYWAPVREPLPDTAENQATVTVSIEEKGSSYHSTTSAAAEGKDSKCPVAEGISRWGIPKATGDTKPQIHAIIATVPDPVHTHLAMNFDRDIDALIQAAGDNRYVPSYYWLPWKTHEGSLRVLESGGDEGSQRERQPGLIVFKKEGSLSTSKYDLNSDYYEVVYLFLVGETPVLGVSGEQLRNTFRYESELSGILGDNNVVFSMKPGPVKDLAIIGPNFSGSAASLRQGIEAARLDQQSFLAQLNVNIAGITQTQVAANLLSQQTDTAPSYLSFSENFTFARDQIFDALAYSGVPLNRVAELSEDSTVFGRLGICGDRAQEADQKKTPESNSDQKHPCGTEKDQNGPENKPLFIRFPREISLLRNAHAHTDTGEQLDAQGKSTPTPFLHLSLKDQGPNDSVSQFSPDHTPESQEAQLMSISRLLQRAHTQFIVINSSNVLDRLFLAQFLHRACPEARLAFIGGDLLFGRETENVPYVGGVTVSAYSQLSPTLASGTNSVRAFADSATEAYFNAASYTFWDGIKDDLHLANFRNPLQPDDNALHATLWASTIGLDGYYPLGIVNDCASDSPNILPTIDDANNSVTGTRKCGTAVDGASVQQPHTDILTFLGWPFNVWDGHLEQRQYRYPALSWEAACIAISLLCLMHSLAISFPRYWSPWTRDLAIDRGDEPNRRSMYIFIGTVMLFCLAFATAYPAVASFRIVHPNRHTLFFCLVTMIAGGAALFATLRKTRSYLKEIKAFQEFTGQCNWLERRFAWVGENASFLFARAAWTALIFFPLLWIYICNAGILGPRRTFVGPLFSYRCLYPGSGVSPLVPILFILLGWYLWAFFQALRLRFSHNNRPRLPGIVSGSLSWPLYVSEVAVTTCEGEMASCLTSNVNCLLITLEVVKRFIPKPKWLPSLLLGVFFFGLFCMLIFWLHFSSVERFLWEPGKLPTPYEFLVAAIAFPLVMIALSGWLRMMLIWSSLKRGLLEPLEQLPIRYAFTRLKGVGWLNMMRQGGLLEQWRDMARSTESIRQMAHYKDLLDGFGYHEPQEEALKRTLDDLDRHIATILGIVAGKQNGPQKEALVEEWRDIARSTESIREMAQDGSLSTDFCLQNQPQGEHLKRTLSDLDTHVKKFLTLLEPNGHEPRAGLQCMVAIEKCYAKACEALLEGILIPYWEKTRVGLVEGEELTELPIKAHPLPKAEVEGRTHTSLQLHTSTVAEEPTYIRVAEEFLAIRYVSFIRAVLVNMRQLLQLITSVFVLTIVAWNSYPFQPRQWIDEAFTALFLLLGTGIVWIFAQMHRNAILSRITDTNANELGWDFYLRIATFGAVPVLTWLAYQFPEVGGSLFKLIQPSLDVIR
jgi:hypothetical protein